MYERKIILGFIRIHILYHATEEKGIYGVEMMKELERHGYKISPGTLYPILHKMKKDKMLKIEKNNINGKIRIIYRTTIIGEKTLEKLKIFVKELSQEVLT
jgi:DNA-binding PadR family transcriptional regulator